MAAKPAQSRIIGRRPADARKTAAAMAQEALVTPSKHFSDRTNCMQELSDNIQLDPKRARLLRLPSVHLWCLIQLLAGFERCHLCVAKPRAVLKHWIWAGALIKSLTRITGKTEVKAIEALAATNMHGTVKPDVEGMVQSQSVTT